MAAEVCVDFDAGTQSLTALNAAAYRLMGTGTCHIDKLGNRYVCRLTSATTKRENQDSSESLRLRFLDLVTDENVREGLRTKTEPVRNLILSLAFGSLVEQPEHKS